MPNDSLDQVIMDSVDAAAFDDEPAEVAGSEAQDPVVEAAASDDAVTTDTATDTEPVSDGQVAAPKADAAADAVTDEDPLKQFGIPSRSVTGRDNPIPYSRVRKIVDKNTKDITAKVTKDVESKYTPQLQERDTKIKDYEERLDRVGQFEQIMEHKPREFLQMLSNLPAYKPFFEAVARVAQAQQSGTGAAPTTAPTVAGSTDDPMPQPNRKLTDGSEFYDMEGLQKLLDWQTRQVEKRVTQQLESRVSERYGPIEQEWRRNQQIAQVMPIIEQQIAEARTWPLFSENEPAIIEALQKDQRLSLEGAYRQIVVPKMTADKNRMRTEILDEIRRKPSATAAPATRTTPRAAAAAAPKSGDDVILAALAEAGIQVSKDRD